MPPSLGVGDTRRQLVITACSRRVASRKLLSRQIRLHDTIDLEAMSTGIVDEIANRVDLLAHGVRHHGDVAPRARIPNSPGHRIERGHAHKTHFERARDPLRCRHGDAYAGKRAGTAPHAHAHDVLAGDAAFGKQRVDSGDELRVRLAARLHFGMGDKLERTRGRAELAHADGDHLVCGVEGQNVGRFLSGCIAIACGRL